MKPQTIKVSYDTPEDEALFRWAAKHVDPEAKRRNDERIRESAASGPPEDCPWPEPLESIRAFFTRTFLNRT